MNSTPALYGRKLRLGEVVSWPNHVAAELELSFVWIKSPFPCRLPRTRRVNARPALSQPQVPRGSVTSPSSWGSTSQQQRPCLEPEAQEGGGGESPAGPHPSAGW